MNRPTGWMLGFILVILILTIPAVALATDVGAEPRQPIQAEPTFVPFVTPQQVRPDGSVVHVVQQGDTFSSIFVAYLYLGIEQDSMLALNGYRFVPDFLRVGQELIILPAGSVDPTTGEVLSLTGSAPAAPPEQPAADTSAPQTNTVVELITPAQPSDPASVPTVAQSELASIPALEVISPFVR